jgi:hypothetical protein
MASKYVKLVKKFPTIFKRVHYIECGVGWYDLLYKLCQDIIKHDPKHRVVASQVKEKFGGLRFYTDYYDKKTGALIDKAERESYKICEVCGSRSGVKQTSGWVISLCPKHYKENTRKWEGA